MIKGLYKIFDHWHMEGTVWIYSDPHFNQDEDILVSFPDRPAAQEHIKLINSKVGKKDHLILLGDIGDIECVQQLRGHKILIKGNHDSGLSNYEDVFDEVYGGPLMIGEKLILSHEPLSIDWAYNIHGHDHNGFAFTKGHMNVCADVIGYCPVSLNTFVKSGKLKEVVSIHRDTIDKATKRKDSRMTPAEKINRYLSQYENGKYHEKRLEEVSDYICWAWKWKKISRAEMEDFAERVCNLFEKGYK